ncbi:hypothetical protein [Winogradskyella sp. PE311]|uniref:hypothetical protein n=1 Tax=Winogradskyella sp. PE311 TaxID=3366943 RepID=UPI0039808B52
MIKFFRKIRQKMLTENKFSKYFLYAIGEITLVIIGILLALAINDWKNEQRINSEETATLQKLIQDLKSDNESYNENINYYSNLGERLINLKEIIYKKSLSDDDIKQALRFPGATFIDLNPRKTTYEEMLNSGRVYNLSSEILVDKIIAYYQFLEGRIYQTKESRKEFRAIYYGPNFTDFWYWKGDKNPFPYAKIFFSNNDSPTYRILKQCSAWSIAINNGLLDDNNKLLKMSNELIEYINEELTRKKTKG